VVAAWLVAEPSRRTLSSYGAALAACEAATFEDDANTIVGRWEKALDGRNYDTDFDLIYRKVK